MTHEKTQEINLVDKEVLKTLIKNHRTPIIWIIADAVNWSPTDAPDSLAIVILPPEGVNDDSEYYEKEGRYFFTTENGDKKGEVLILDQFSHKQINKYLRQLQEEETT